MRNRCIFAAVLWWNEWNGKKDGHQLVHLSFSHNSALPRTSARCLLIAAADKDYCSATSSFDIHSVMKLRDRQNNERDSERMTPSESQTSQEQPFYAM